jgi:hypothetical protein
MRSGEETETAGVGCHALLRTGIAGPDGAVMALRGCGALLGGVAKVEGPVSDQRLGQETGSLGKMKISVAVDLGMSPHTSRSCQITKIRGTLSNSRSSLCLYFQFCR